MANGHNIKNFVHNLSEFESKRLTRIKPDDGLRIQCESDEEYQQYLTKILRDNGHKFNEILSVQTHYQAGRKATITVQCSI